MSRAFSTIAYTPSVRAAQERYGSRAANARFDDDPVARDHVSPRDRDFIESVETFFMASVGENGWPYVQHRGGPRGFLKVLDGRTLGFADFSGNRQYISAGNLEHDGRVMLVLMNFAVRGRLKIWGRARIVHERDDPALLARLALPGYRARIERAFVITVEAFDFNCSQHIVQRFSEEELGTLGRDAQGRAWLGGLLGMQPEAAPPALGDGPLALEVCGVRQLTPWVRAYRLRAAEGGPALPAPAPGAHLALPVRLQDGAMATRRYSLMAAGAGEWEVAVLRREEGGGSAALQRDYGLGTVLRVAPPRNDFTLHPDARPAVLIAGGIGVTALRPMAMELAARAAPYALHYAARSRAAMAYRDELAPGAVLYAGDEGRRLDLDRIFAQADPEALFYVCGPERLIAAARAAAARHGVDEARIRVERFDAPGAKAADAPVTLELRRSGLTLEVPAGVTLLDAIEAAGVAAPSDCRVGNCGTCAVKVLDGVPDHRDSALTRGERELAALMCPCVSRAAGARLALDL